MTTARISPQPYSITGYEGLYLEWRAETKVTEGFQLDGSCMKWMCDVKESKRGEFAQDNPCVPEELGCRTKKDLFRDFPCFP